MPLHVPISSMKVALAPPGVSLPVPASAMEVAHALPGMALPSTASTMQVILSAIRLANATSSCVSWPHGLEYSIGLLGADQRF